MFFFFQAEDGIRDYKVTGVQTCALPIHFTWRAHCIACVYLLAVATIVLSWASFTLCHSVIM